MPSEIKRLLQLEEENTRLKQRGANLSWITSVKDERKGLSNGDLERVDEGIQRRVLLLNLDEVRSIEWDGNRGFTLIVLSDEERWALKERIRAEEVGRKTVRPK